MKSVSELKKEQIKQTNYQRNNFVKIDGQRLSNVKDELEYATNWRRAFGELHQKLRWLNAYAKIN